MKSFANFAAETLTLLAIHSHAQRTGSDPAVARQNREAAGAAADELARNGKDCSIGLAVLYAYLLIAVALGIFAVIVRFL